MNDTTLTQITFLNEIVKLRLAPSKIHGIGVFALRDIKKGEKLYSDLMPKLFTLTIEDLQHVDNEIRSMILERWPQIVNGSKFMYPDTKMVAYMNHADEPNVDAQQDIALKDIKKGEELTENYTVIPNWQQAHPWLVKK